jgi:hypothetical protein
MSGEGTAADPEPVISLSGGVAPAPAAGDDAAHAPFTAASLDYGSALPPAPLQFGTAAAPDPDLAPSIIETLALATISLDGDAPPPAAGPPPPPPAAAPITANYALASDEGSDAAASPRATTFGAAAGTAHAPPGPSSLAPLSAGQAARATADGAASSLSLSHALTALDDILTSPSQAGAPMKISIRDPERVEVSRMG